LKGLAFFCSRQILSKKQAGKNIREKLYEVLPTCLSFQNLSEQKSIRIFWRKEALYQQPSTVRRKFPYHSPTAKAVVLQLK
jgi:hypothetical protein